MRPIVQRVDPRQATNNQRISDVWIGVCRLGGASVPLKRRRPRVLLLALASADGGLEIGALALVKVTVREPLPRVVRCALAGDARQSDLFRLLGRQRYDSAGASEKGLTPVADILPILSVSERKCTHGIAWLSRIFDPH